MIRKRHGFAGIFRHSLGWMVAAWAACGLGGAIPQARAEAPPERLAMLARGVNITNWFRFPADGSLRALQGYMDDAAVAKLKRAGFTYVRLPIGPEAVMRGDGIEGGKLEAIIAATKRFQRAGLAVMVEMHPQNLGNWVLQDSAPARQRVLGFWRDLAPALAQLPPELTFPEPLNEPTLPDAAQWDGLQAQVLQIIRAAMPRHTVVLTGTNWGSIDGLLQVTPVADPNVVYTFHTYEPQLFATLVAWEPGVDQAALGRLPFPVANRQTCEATVAGIQHQRTRDIANYWCSEPHDAATIATNIGRAADWSKRHRVSVAMTEFGADRRLNPAARLAYLEAVRRAAEQHRIPWALWGLDDSNGFGIEPGRFTAGTELQPGILRALGLASADRR